MTENVSVSRQANSEWKEFGNIATTYNSRPNYPDEIFVRLNEILASNIPNGKLALEVGAGTGIFSRSLARYLPDNFRVIALEPSDEMRLVAGEASKEFPRLEYRSGIAEELPFDTSVADLVAAASAAHRFDRPRFFAECKRVLVPKGVLVLTNYSHARRKDGTFSDGYCNLLEKVLPGYTRHAHASGHGTYIEVDVCGEAIQSTHFELIRSDEYFWPLYLSRDQLFSYLAASTVYQRALRVVQEHKLAAMVGDIFGHFCDERGVVSMGCCAEASYLRRIHE
ncbi:class I SAM-dependent methyltransferase [Mesorhizobium sp. WSM2561]|uniref:class I SAM-dependent methyltransferase n=1 Tax=Mesorhizobium sp. WSM2561 TaxID=1040985 RepID=UPI000489BF3F|nr:class I SAM-dependent methyltransferase [Mesorhizobium sp. WSM2561]